MATFKGSLKFGLKIGDEVHKDFELVEPIAAHIFDAEATCSADTAITFKTSILCQQLVRIGTFEGPFTVKLLRSLKVSDLNRLLDGQKEADKLGEAAAPASAPG
jgi:phage FluMu protein gp41